LIGAGKLWFLLAAVAVVAVVAVVVL
jgi:hypothetical protein